MDAHEIVKLVVTAPSADNCQPWAFRVEGNTLQFFYHHRLSTTDLFGPYGHTNVLVSGALLENLHVILPPGHSSPEWRAASNSWEIILNDLHQITGVSANTISLLLSRHTNRYPFKPIEEEDLALLPTYPGCRAIVATSPSAIRTIAHAVMQCSAARFNCKELHEWLFSSIRWTSAEIDTGTGLDINTLHLPPGGRTFMHWISPWPRMQLLNRFGFGRVMASADAALVREAPAIIALVSGNSPLEIVESGRLMQRIWLELNARGVAVHPYYVLTDQWNRRKSGKLDPKWNTTIDSAVSIANEALGLTPEEHIHMLLRVGRPSYSPVRSRRLPVPAFMDAST